MTSQSGLADGLLLMEQGNMVHFVLFSRVTWAHSHGPYTLVKERADIQETSWSLSSTTTFCWLKKISRLDQTQKMQKLTPNLRARCRDLEGCVWNQNHFAVNLLLALLVFNFSFNLWSWLVLWISTREFGMERNTNERNSLWLYWRHFT